MTLSILLQGQAQGNNWSFFLMIGLMFVVLYFFMIRPQQKKQKEVEKQRAALKAGDKVILSSGIHGKLKEVNDANCVVEIADGVKITVDKASIFASA